ncbi:MAG: extracellular solute-binding protein, partial [Chloroflexi bacterium]|nr:extracellular solute-binding protein [Chloroflexota bacterium]
PEWARSPQGLWAGVSGRARVLVYSPDRVPEDEFPADIFELTDPKWKGRVGWAPTNGSFLTMVTGMRKIWGEEKTAEWIEGMVANGATIYPKNTPQVAAVAAGEIDIGLVNHYYLYRFISEEGEDFAARNYHPSGGGPGALVMVSGAGILSTAENRENAERFVEFLLGTVAQQFFAGQTFEYPLVEGVNVNRLLTPLDEIKRPDIALADLADLEGTTAILRDLGALP